MRESLRQNPGQGRVSTTESTAAPINGWNARDSIANMDPLDAVVLDNWFPTTSDIKLRKGSLDYATGLSTTKVETLITYRPASGSQKLFGFAGTNLYDLSLTGPIGAAVVSALTNAQWQCTNFATSGGNFLLCVNGVDSLQYFDGAAWTAITAVSIPAITGVATTSLIHVHVFKERVWYIQKNSRSVWYSAAGAFAGALTEFPLTSVFKKGGYLVSMGTWTIDGGNGSDDYAVFISSEGETAVYQGTNPASATTWAQVGIYTLGKPIGYRCMEQLAGDLLIITTDGVVPASKAFVKARSENTIAITDRIQGGMSEAVSAYSANNGWSLTLYPEGSALFLSVPSQPKQQFVMNTVTKAWCRFIGWEANCFETYKGELYFGTQGKVVRAWVGTSDNALAIQAEVVQAFNYFENRDQQKLFTMVQPIIGWDSNPVQILIGVDIDFEIVTPTNEITLPQSSGGIWDVALWDVDVWGGPPTLKKAWYSVGAIGFAAAFHMKVSSTAATQNLAAINYVFQNGGVL